MELSTKESYKLLHEALISAFPSQRHLAQFIEDSLDVNLEQITGINPDNQLVLELINFLDARGRLNELVEAVSWSNFKSPEVDAFLGKFLDSRPTIRRTPRTGQGFIEPLLVVADALPLHMVLIPGGTFRMGSPDDAPERTDAEGPQHEVTVPTFLMGRYPVTQAQYEKVMATNPTTEYDTDRFVAPNKPVVGVTWYDAVEFCDRLTLHTNRQYRLPSEAEWEYACRAGTKTPFYFGKSITTKLANYDGPNGDYREGTTSVDLYGIANAFGLSDMHGNVFEWCQDYWHENYEDAPADGSAWIKGGDSSLRVIRGGAWNDNLMLCRSAFRLNLGPGFGPDAVSFRVCCSAPKAF
ncbi:MULTISPECIES: SUMF1/EgtB/PvdO family nonheme iron enzyme [Cyanophyceae]|uniref:SUMF1/EgtB/PvdO family nonheme iron enzyme n=1 Tax=Cyanophyceae TaxID=3028117 RepID=UPI001688BE63|nr:MULTISPECIES: SUMF1/EgtB/PvdO family nonheme iron enzyme [Cyanophyceae]MBD1919454.1 formylglycine-generating enzyme family protein [Phormidium sp. FACHB-77]MBD2054306.1 formylglycine-generating enzyme family protein [Leptolyngbya sp. FACHB-60]